MAGVSREERRHIAALLAEVQQGFAASSGSPERAEAITAATNSIASLVEERLGADSRLWLEWYLG